MAFPINVERPNKEPTKMTYRWNVELVYDIKCLEKTY